MSKLLTKKDLAERWQVSQQTIDLYRQNGIIIPIKGLPCIRFNEQYIEKIEGRIPERTTMRERKLEMELEKIKRERDYFKELLQKILTESSEIINFVNSSKEVN